jgi:hypothetical protein
LENLGTIAAAWRPISARPVWFGLESAAGQTGHVAQEPFPAEDPIQRADIQNLIHSEVQPPK